MNERQEYDIEFVKTGKDATFCPAVHAGVDGASCRSDGGVRATCNRARQIKEWQ